MEQKRMPSCCCDEHLDFLDSLRASGKTNMFGAAPYLVDEFGITKADARTILGYWMETFPRTQNPTATGST